MTQQIVFTPAARNDLFELYDYVADRSSPDTALSYIHRIEQACESLATFPNRGTLRNDLRPGLRVVGFERRVTIAFRAHADSVAILRILYAGRNMDSAFSEYEN
jgi:toxin ParE1/3/4